MALKVDRYLFQSSLSLQIGSKRGDVSKAVDIAEVLDHVARVACSCFLFVAMKTHELVRGGYNGVMLPRPAIELSAFSGSCNVAGSSSIESVFVGSMPDDTGSLGIAIPVFVVPRSSGSPSAGASPCSACSARWRRATLRASRAPRSRAMRRVLLQSLSGAAPHHCPLRTSVLSHSLHS